MGDRASTVRLAGGRFIGGAGGERPMKRGGAISDGSVFLRWTLRLSHASASPSISLSTVRGVLGARGLLSTVAMSGSRCFPVVVGRGEARREDFREAMVEVLASVLASPKFLYLVRGDQKDKPANQRVIGVELASRLAFFSGAVCLMLNF